MHFFLFISFFLSFYIFNAQATEIFNMVENFESHSLKNSSSVGMSVNASNGKIIFAQNSNKRIFPGKTSLMMNLYLILEKLRDKIISLEDCIHYNYLDGEKCKTVKNLIMLINLESSEEAISVLAKEISLKEDEFLKMMNIKAQELNLKNTNFDNIRGKYSKNNYSTARDLLSLAIRLLHDFPKYRFLLLQKCLLDHSNIIERKKSIEDKFKGILYIRDHYYQENIDSNILTYGEYNDIKLFTIVIDINDQEELMKELIWLIEKSLTLEGFDCKKDYKKNLNNDDVLIEQIYKMAFSNNQILKLFEKLKDTSYPEPILKNYTEKNLKQEMKEESKNINNNDDRDIINVDNLLKDIIDNKILLEDNKKKSDDYFRSVNRFIDQ